MKVTNTKSFALFTVGLVEGFIVIKGHLSSQSGFYSGQSSVLSTDSLCKSECNFPGCNQFLMEKRNIWRKLSLWTVIALYVNRGILIKRVIFKSVLNSLHSQEMVKNSS